MYKHEIWMYVLLTIITWIKGSLTTWSQLTFTIDCHKSYDCYDQAKEFHLQSFQMDPCKAKWKLLFKFPVKCQSRQWWYLAKAWSFLYFLKPHFCGVVLLLEGSYWIRLYFSIATLTWLVKEMQKPRGLQ